MLCLDGGSVHGELGGSSLAPIRAGGSLNAISKPDDPLAAPATGSILISGGGGRFHHGSLVRVDQSIALFRD